MAVTVLALGLLGIAAVFPVVISQQRTAQDETAGLAASIAVAGELSRAEDLVDWDALLGDLAFDVPGDAGKPNASFIGCSGSRVIAYPTGLWATNWTGSAGVASPVVPGLRLSEYRDNGVIEVDVGLPWACVATGSQTVNLVVTPRQLSAGPGVVDPALVEIQPAARLLPQPFSGDQPVYVWDPVLRRSVAGELEAAIFVRRIDATIRVPSGQTMSDVLAGPGGGRLPVTVRGQGQQYSLPRSFGAYFSQGREADRLFITADNLDGRSTAAERNAAIRPGQRLLDNLGVVRRVVRVVGPNPAALNELEVVVSPPSSASQALTVQQASGGGSGTLRGFGTSSPTPVTGLYRVVRQVVFTDESPADVFVRKVGG